MQVSAVSKKIGKRIRQIREDKSVTQEDLAGEAGLNRAYVGYIERGERNPSTDTLEKISKVLKVPLKDLFK
ncbi:MAG: helix-turn-helix domain-containing protein [Candidatus Curtissbacteria bacterium]|nr:helix-turn-helix domain-containing protein [Candidatus Curtissbacteria bacterium]